MPLETGTLTTKLYRPRTTGDLAPISRVPAEQLKSDDKEGLSALESELALAAGEKEGT